MVINFKLSEMNNTTTNQVDDGIVPLLGINEVLFNPIDPVFFLIIIKCICCSIGIPLNVSIAVTIIRHEQFRSKPRKIFLLGIILSNLSFFIPALIILIYWSWFPVESLCQTYVTFVGVPQSLLLSNMLLALIDRYLAINDPMAHRDKMTVRLACAIVILSSVFIVFLLKFVYVAKLIPLRCDVQPIHSNILAAILVTLFLSCIAMNVIVYRQTKIILRRDSRTLSPTGSEDVPPNAERTIVININESASLYELSVINGPMSIHVDRRKTLEMEVEAICTLIIGVTSLFVTVCPIFILLFIIIICQLVFSDGDLAECRSLTWLMTYFKELGSVHAVYSPLIFLVRNKELRVSLFG